MSSTDSLPPVPAQHDNAAVITISAGHKPTLAYLRESMQASNILRVLVWRDLKVRYKQTVVGVAWAVFQPIFTLIIYSIVFGHFAKFPSAGLPYPVFVFAALLPWQYAARILNEGSSSVAGNANLVTKIYFPRLILPMSVVFSALVDLLIGLMVTFAVMAFYGVAPSWHIIALPLFWLWTTMVAVSVMLWFAALDVLYRDIRFVLPIISQLLLYVSPIVYPVDMIPERWRLLYYMNPFAIMADGFRWSLFGTPFKAPIESVLGAGFIVIVLTIGGLRCFQRTERIFADRI